MQKSAYLFLLLALLVCVLGYLNRDEFAREYRFTQGERYTVLDDAFATTTVSAASFLVFDVETGRTFASRNPDTLHEMASVVKLITADTALSSEVIDASTTVSWRAVATSGKSGHLSAGDEYRVRELVFPLLLESSNDAAEAIAEKSGRTAFIAAMNTRVREMGMASTAVVDPSGLSRGNISTAHDLQKLLTRLFIAHRHVLDITTLRMYVGAEHTWQNNDPVFSSAGFIGGKHGYTDTAGRTIALISLMSFQGSDETYPVGIILLNSENITQDVASVTAEMTRTVRGETRVPRKLP